MIIFFPVFLFNALVLFYIIEFGRLLCPNFDKAWNSNEVAQHQASGWRTKRLHRIGFVPGNDEAAFGFLDPSRVVKGVHLHVIPAFAWGRTTELLPPKKIARSMMNDSEDWTLFYIEM